MLNLLGQSAEGKPVSGDVYFDKLQLWLSHPISKPGMGWLRLQLPPQFRRGRLRKRVHVETFLWPRDGYIQRVELRRPNLAVLEWLACRRDARINQVEFALDLAFAATDDREAARGFFDRHLIRPYHNKNQRIRYCERTRYDGQQKHANKIALYPEEYSRNTGECFPLIHLEWRASRLRSVRQAGIYEPADVLNFDFYSFWRKHLRLVDLDPERLGRLIRNRNEGTRSRAPLYGSDCFGAKINLDRRCGSRVMKAFLSENYDNPVVVLQRVADRYRKLRVSDFLVRLSNEPFLPGEGAEAFTSGVGMEIRQGVPLV